MMNITDVYEYAKMKHNGQFRKDKVTEYINHPLSICDELYRLKITKKAYTENDKDDYCLYAIALLHDVLEDTDADYYELENKFGEYVAKGVKALTFCDDKNNPFAKTGYLFELCNSNNDVFTIKILDRLCNVRDFIKSGDEKYARRYFHKADVLFSELYKRKGKVLMEDDRYNILWNEVMKYEKQGRF